ncbi:MAG: hypothetical protein AAF493_12495 [Pseudomonadota bacterium]
MSATSLADTSRYTYAGCDTAETVIDDHQHLVAKAVKAAVPAVHLRALVLIGGYGRGEGGVQYRADGPRPYNDYDYFAVVEGVSGSAVNALNAQLKAVAHELETEVGVEVDFALLHYERLAEAERSLMNAEMLWGHRVVMGPSDILSTMPTMPFESLSLSEFTRLMTNRGSLLLINERDFARNAINTREAREQCVKYFFKSELACGDAILARVGRYDPSYPVKEQRLTVLERELATPDAATIDRYTQAVAAKFAPDYDAFVGRDLATWQRIAVEHWRATFAILESRRLGWEGIEWTAYRSPRVSKGQGADRNLSWLRNAYINRREFGFSHLVRAGIWAIRHPRERLVSALPHLLAKPSAPDQRCTDALMLPPGASWSTCTDQYLRLWSRFS